LALLITHLAQTNHPKIVADTKYKLKRIKKLFCDVQLIAKNG